MKKRIVVLAFKEDTEREYIYPSVPELIREQGENIGITRNALWNALSKNNGVYENKVCRICYRNNSAITTWE